MRPRVHSLSVLLARVCQADDRDVNTPAEADQHRADLAPRVIADAIRSSEDPARLLADLIEAGVIAVDHTKLLP